MYGATEKSTGGAARRPAWRSPHHGGAGRGGAARRRAWNQSAEFARRRSLSYRLPAASVAEQRHTARLAVALLRIGVNLNQLTHRANAGREPPPDYLRALADRINAL